MSPSLPAVNLAGYVNADFGSPLTGHADRYRVAAHLRQQTAADLFLSILKGGVRSNFPPFTASRLGQICPTVKRRFAQKGLYSGVSVERSSLRSDRLVGEIDCLLHNIFRNSKVEIPP
jgi:hypothetical protein